MKFPKPVKSTDPWIDFCPSEYYVKEQVDVWREALRKYLVKMRGMRGCCGCNDNGRCEAIDKVLEWLSE